MSSERSSRGRAGTPRIGRRAVLQSVIAGAIGSSGAARAVADQSDDVSWDTGVVNACYASPTVVEEAVYVARDGHVSALRTSSGSEEWQSPDLGEEARASPTVVDGVVFAAGSGSLYALDAEDGTIAWEAELGDDVRSSPAVVDGTVYVSVREAVDTSDATNAIHAVDAETGERRWRTEVLKSGGGTLDASPVVADGTVFASDQENRIVALDADTGEEEWHVRVDAPEYSPTVLEDPRDDRSGNLVLYPTGTEGLYAFEADDGDGVWHLDRSEIDVDTTATVADVEGLGPTAFLAGHETLYAVDVAAGEVEWTYDVGDTVRSAPTVTNQGIVYVAVGDGVYGVEAATGFEDVAFEQGGIDYSSPTVAQGKLYVCGRSGTVYAFDVDPFAESAGSRTSLGTLGHHGDWRHADQSIDLEFASQTEAEDGADDTDDADGEGDDGDGGDANGEAADGGSDEGSESGDEQASAAGAEEAERGSTDGEDGAGGDVAAGDADEQPSDRVPGFGLGAALAGLGAGYLLGRRDEADDHGEPES